MDKNEKEAVLIANGWQRYYPDEKETWSKGDLSGLTLDEAYEIQFYIEWVRRED
jgi:hypothetical protein